MKHGWYPKPPVSILSGYKTAGGPGGNSTPGEQNIALNFSNSRITGVITSSEAHHHVASIDSAQYRQLGEVTNTPHAAINNGAIVSLTDGSHWALTGTSYLTKLFVEAGSLITGSQGRRVTMTVNGAVTPIVAGTTYTGTIRLTL